MRVFILFSNPFAIRFLIKLSPVVFRNKNSAEKYVEAYRSGHNGLDSKSSDPEMGPWVRIPPLPPTKDADIDTMSASFILPEKSLFTGLFGLFHVWRRFKVQAHFCSFRFRMVVCFCTLKRKRLGVQKRVHSETEHFRVRSGMKKAEAHLASTLISFPFLNSNVMLPSRFTVPFSSSSDHT